MLTELRLVHFGPQTTREQLDKLERQLAAVEGGEQKV